MEVGTKEISISRKFMVSITNVDDDPVHALADAALWYSVAC